MSGNDPDEQSRRDEISERLEESADKAIEGFDQRLVDLLSWILETETKARIYVYLRQNQDSTSEEIAEGTGLYPSTVREALAEMSDDAVVDRNKRESEGAGNNPYEYTAVAPSELVGSAKDQIQQQLNTVFNLDNHLRQESPPESEPVTITVEDESEPKDPNGSNEETTEDTAEDDGDSEDE